MESRAQTTAEETHLPKHVAIIMDGNGRWAEQRGLSRLAGHIAGLDRARATINYLNNRHIKYLTLFGFSTENWNRPQDEVDNILHVFTKIIDQEALAFHKQGIRLRCLGRLTELPPVLQESIKQAIELTRDNFGMTFNLAFNYGGRTEILDAMRQIMAENIPPQDITEELFSNYLYTAGTPDVDLLIRTGGEFRISNFLIWQSVYSEYYFTDVFWPDFDEAEIDKALEAYQQRQRRFGGL